MYWNQYPYPWFCKFETYNFLHKHYVYSLHHLNGHLKRFQCIKFCAHCPNPYKFPLNQKGTTFVNKCRQKLEGNENVCRGLNSSISDLLQNKLAEVKIFDNPHQFRVLNLQIALGYPSNGITYNGLPNTPN